MGMGGSDMISERALQAAMDSLAIERNAIQDMLSLLDPDTKAIWAMPSLRNGNFGFMVCFLVDHSPMIWT